MRFCCGDHDKFTHGAWIVLVLLPALVVMFSKIRFHYQVVAAQWP